ncbi:7279_t:CDS:1 [Scutellospora calospora]|uniref:7279_t:CDS:1 n=1 Tax=Scutellospora calospora TaxID=85575 RepID=A0ACA9KNB7_9GLOM|nr:7279_t:CDS:1 [Scutellospora calospora]
MPNEIKMIIFQYVRFPANLAVSHRDWSIFARDPQVRAGWIILQYGQIYCLFHAVRLGPKFINVKVARQIIIKGGFLTTYLAKCLLMHYGNYRYDKKLIEMRKFEINKLQLSVFTLLFDSSLLKGNNMKKFYYLPVDLKRLMMRQTL